MKRVPLVSIALLNWNGTEDTKICLQSLWDLNYDNYEILLVDNGSQIDELDELKAFLKENEKRTKNLKLIALPKNTGFTGGNIAAYEQASGDYMFLINNDSVMDKDIIGSAMTIFDNDESIAVVGGRAFFWNESNPLFSEKNEYYTYQMINPITAEVETLTSGLPFCQPNNVSGSAVFIKRSAIELVGYFDPSFFAYYEETDLFARMKRAGLKVVYSDTIKIWHKVGASTSNKKAFFWYLIFKNQFLYAAKNFDGFYYRAFLKYYFVLNLKVLGHLILMRDVTLNWARLKGCLWNIGHLFPTLAKRRKLHREFPGNYSEELIREHPASVSVIIDGSRSLEDISKTIESIDQQSVSPKEVLLVLSHDDKSLVGELHKNYPFVRVVRNRGLLGSLSWHLGTVCSSGKWLLRLHSGDELGEDFLENALVSAWASRRDATLGIQHKPSGFTYPSKLVIESASSLLISRDLYNANADYSSVDNASDLLALASSLFGRGIGVARFEGSINPGPQSGSFRSEVAQKLSGRSLRSPFSYWLLSEMRPLYKLVRSLYDGIKASKPGIWTKLGIANILELQHSPNKLAFISALNPLQLKKLKKTLWRNFDNFKARRTGKVTLRSSAKRDSYDPEKLVVYLNCRDRYDSLMLMIQWLERAGLKKIVLIDNDSTYKPLLDFYGKTGYQVLPLKRNAGHKSPWESKAIASISSGNYYIVSDPDIIPVKECPLDAVEYFHKLLLKYPEILKVGFGLKIDDLPDHYHLKKVVVDWESQFWKDEVEPGVYKAAIDTTFALYRPDTWYFLEESLRTGEPYVARHTPWYSNPKKPSDEDKHYKRHASNSVNTWNKDDIPEHFKEAIAVIQTDEQT